MISCTERAIQTVGSSTVVPFDVGRAIYRTDTNETVGIVGKNYKLLPHAPLYQTVNENSITLIVSSIILMSLTKCSTEVHWLKEQLSVKMMTTK